jgi:tetratricopeptide (TPR) repeat protein
MKRFLALALLAAVLLGSAPAGARLLARVEPGWSPFARGPVPEELASLVTEARGLLATDPERVAFVLGRSPVPAGLAGRLLQGLRADALYQVGGEAVFEAQRLYRSLETGADDPAELAWVRFMLANIHRGLGFDREAEARYREALGGPEGPWTPALRFDLAALVHEGGRTAEAREAFLAWLQAYPNEPGRALVLYLLGEAEAALGDESAARLRFREARALEPEGWLVRAQTGHALAEGLLRDGKAGEAVQVLEALAESRHGTAEGARAQLRVGEIWEARGEVARAARTYAELLAGGTTLEAAREAVLRLALLGAEHADRVDLTEPFPSYRVFYRPQPSLEEIAAARDPLAAQRALRGLAGLARRQGRELEALSLLVRVFRTYPETPESGRAYEEFMTALEGHLKARLAAGAPAEVVLAYETFREAAAWAPTRETGPLAVAAAEAYEALGTPSLARALYEELQDRGTRALAPAELEVRILRARAAEGDLEALRRLAQTRRDWRAYRALARREAALPTSANREGARRTYLEAIAVAPGPSEKAELLAEADGLLAPQRSPADLLEALQSRRRAWQSLPAGPEREAWEAAERLTEGRLRYALGEAQMAARLLRAVPGLGPDDRYVLALAERAAGRPSEARALWEALAAEDVPPFSGLARVHLELAAFPPAAERRP